MSEADEITIAAGLIEALVSRCARLGVSPESMALTMLGAASAILVESRGAAAASNAWAQLVDAAAPERVH